MLRLRDTSITPPGYWIFPRFYPEDRKDLPAEQRFIRAGDYGDLIKRVTEFRIINNRPLGDPEAEINDWICRNSGAPCAPAVMPKPGAAVKAGGSTVARFLYAMAAWMVSRETVPQEEAERRAEICAGCVHNVPIEDQNCLGCFSLASRIMQVIGDRRTKLDDILQFCGRCGCSLKVVPWTPMDILDRSHSNSDFAGVETGQFANDGSPVKCWRGEA